MVSRSQISPVSSGPMPSLPAPSMHSPANMQQGRFTYGPVLSNIHNPNGQPMLVGGLPHGMVANFNSGHAASMLSYGTVINAPAPHSDRPFKCDTCPQSFNRNHDLKRHKRIHLAVKPFPCGHCDKSFSRKDALKVCQCATLVLVEVTANNLFSVMFLSKDVESQEMQHRLSRRIPHLLLPHRL